MAIVSLHPVVVHLECIRCSDLAIDKDLSLVIDGKVITFIHSDRTFIDRKILESEADGLTLLRNPYRSIVVSGPTSACIERIEVAYDLLSIELYVLDEVLSCLEHLHCMLGERHISILIEGDKVLL